MNNFTRWFDRMCAKRIAAISPIKYGATDIINREISLLKSTSDLPTFDLLVPPFLLRQYQRECAQVNAPDFKCGGVYLRPNPNKDMFEAVKPDLDFAISSSEELALKRSIQITVGKLDGSNMVVDEANVSSMDDAVKSACIKSLESTDIATICQNPNSEDGELLYLVIGGEFYRPVEPIDIIKSQ